MKIAIVSTMKGYTWGGSEELWYKMVNYAIDKNDQIALFKYDNKPESNKLKQLKEKEVLVIERLFAEKLYNVISKRFYIRMFGFLNSKFKTEYSLIYQPILDFKPDIVLISCGHTLDPFRDEVLIKFLKAANCPYVILSQYHDEFGADDYESVFRNIFLAKEAKSFYFVSKRNLEVFERQYALKLHNGKVISNPVNLREKSIVAYPKTETIAFANVSRMDIGTKGQDILLEILSTEKWKSRNWVLNLYGSGRGQDILKNLIINYGLSDRVFIKGHVDDIRDVWANNHIMLFPSHGEGTPLALLEALVCGRTAVATDVGGIEDCIVDNENGFLADWGSVRSFGNKLEIAWQKKDQWPQMGAKAHDYILENYNLESFVDLYEDLKKIASQK